MSIEENRRAAFEARDGGEEAVSRYVVVERGLLERFRRRLELGIAPDHEEHWAETLRALLDAPPPDRGDSKECYCNFRAADRAEIERLRADNEALRVALLGIASVNPAERGIEWAKAYASDGLSGTGSELYIRWLETFKEVEALRKDAERYRFLKSTCDTGFVINLEDNVFQSHWDKAIDAAMATKEA